MIASNTRNKELIEFLLLCMLWYLPLALTVPSLLQASGISLLIIAAALIGYRKPLTAVWKRTKHAWLLVAAAFIVGLASSDMAAKSLTGFYNAMRAFAVFFSVSAIIAYLPGSVVLNSAKYLNLSAAIGIFMVWITIGVTGDSFSLRYNAVLSQYIGNLHEFANLAAVCFLMLASLYIANLKTKHWLILPAALLMIVVLATTSKGNWASVLLCLCYLICINKFHYIWYVTLTLFLAAYLYIFFFCTDSCSFPLSLESTIQIRQSINADTLALFSQQPLTGHGMNTFKYSSGLINPAGEPYIMPHNIYIEQLYAWGLLGTGLFFTGLAWLIASVKNPAPVKNTTSLFLHLAGSTLLIYCLSRGLVDLKFFSFHFIGLLAFSLALMQASNLHRGAD